MDYFKFIYIFKEKLQLIKIIPCLFFLVSFLSQSACRFKESNPSARKSSYISWDYNLANILVDTIRINLDDTAHFTSPQIIDSIEYIPLETNNESKIFKIDQLILAGNCFIILDRTSNAVLSFDLNGKFLHKFKLPNGGKIFSMYYDSIDKLIVIKELLVSHLFFYTLDGTLSKIEPVPSKLLFQLKIKNRIWKYLAPSIKKQALDQA